ncbi:hypothetical protein [Aridibaculum aurantiacum]|uniref:hypothetical protein n=1 Tax=Aridibaculum aurantiacum TaxID=2810307 RepID=UPI001A9611B5|nr:hypothetical protein [Aridibaculum aurantiacum]
MKFDDLLAQYLYDTKTLNLQGIGTFTLEGKVSIPYEQDKDIYYPIEGLHFTHNTKVPLDDELVAFLVKKLGKIQPLVRSDLESYLSNVKQFINLGKPYTIEGVGTLHINNSGTYEFTPGNFLPVKEELNPWRENPDHNYPQKDKNSSAGKVFLMVLIVLASLAALAGMGWGVYTLVVNNKPTEQRMPPPVDSLVTESPVVDTNSAAAVAETPTSDTTAYKMIFEVTRLRSRAVNRTAQLQTLNIKAQYDSLGSADAKQYRIYVTKRLMPSDTTRVRDSISRFFLRKVFVEKQ